MRFVRQRRCFISTRNAIGLALVILAASALGCNENLDLHGEADRPFALYGVLTPDRDTQSVRLFVLEESPTLARLDPSRFSLSSTDLSTGNRRVWRDTLIAEAEDGAGLVFWSAFEPAFGHTYRLEAVRLSDGARSYADVRIPPPVTLRLNEERAPLLQVVVEGEDVRVLKPEAEYVVRYPPPSSSPPTRVKFEYHEQEERIENTWTLTLNMIVDYEEIRFIIRASNFCNETVVLDSLKLHLLVGDATWDPPGGVFDPYVLSQPDRMSNVVNGYGFIGGGYRTVKPLFPSPEAVESACFIHAL